ncbi:MAG: pilus assembly protein [Chloroflexi bacterium]|nr:pilus assembly protein [Chloroflexota bacterium]
MGRRRRFMSDDGGRNQVEFTLPLPILMCILMGIMQFGLIFAAYITVNNAVREGARWGSIYVYGASATRPRTARHARTASPSGSSPAGDPEHPLEPRRLERQLRRRIVVGGGHRRLGLLRPDAHAGVEARGLHDLLHDPERGDVERLAPGPLHGGHRVAPPAGLHAAARHVPAGRHDQGVRLPVAVAAATRSRERGDQLDSRSSRPS